MAETIYFNGKKYDSIAEMPSSVRQMYEKINRFIADANQDGVPDVMQTEGIEGLKDKFNVIKEMAQLSSTEGLNQEQLSIIRVTDTAIFVNGKGYNSVDEMPNHVWESYDAAVNAAEDSRAGIYNEPWREVDRDEFFKPHDDEILNRQFNRPSPQNNTSIETVDSTSRFIWLATIAILLMGCAAAAWFIIF